MAELSSGIRPPHQGNNFVLADVVDELGASGVGGFPATARRTHQADVVDELGASGVGGVEGALNASETVPSDIAIDSSGDVPRLSRELTILSRCLVAIRWPVAAYLASRLLLLGTAWLVGHLAHASLAHELSVFDGAWYLRLAAHGYPHVALKTQSTLGFLPLYPMTIWVIARALSISLLGAGLLVTGLGGLVAAVLLQRLVAGWWGEEIARWALLAFLLFPGSIVFSMVYSEGLLIPLMAGCLLALRSRRFLLAGVLASLAGIVEPVGLVAIPVCITAAVHESRSLNELQGELGKPSSGHFRRSFRALLAPVLSVAGIGGFAIYLWVWTGTPFAAYDAQYYGWDQHSDPFRLIGHALDVFFYGLTKLATLHLKVHLHEINLNLINGLLGAVFIVIALVMLFKSRKELTTEALVWTSGIALLTFLSLRTPPNARMIIAAFPATLIWARRLRQKRFVLFLVGEALLLILMSSLTFAGLMRP